MLSGAKSRSGSEKNLIIVESPTKAKTLARFLGSDYKTLATMGHIRDLPKKKLGIDIEKDFKPQYTIPYRAKKSVKLLKEQIGKAENIWLATDYDREGEAIAWHVIQVAKPKTQAKRVTFHEITKSAILEAIENPKKIDQKLVEAQQARRTLDRLVGYKLSPFLWKKITYGLSAGRVQSVTVRLVYDREQEIRKFKTQKYWQITAELSKKRDKKVERSEIPIGNIGKKFRASLVAINGKEFDKLELSQKKAKNVLKDLKGAQYKVANLETRKDKRYPAPPFVTSTMQQEASYKLGFSAKKTMIVAQQLYEGVKIVAEKGRTGLITYHRTDSTKVSVKAQFVAQKVIQELFGKKYTLEKPRQYKTQAKGAQEAHEAVRPTIPSLEPGKIKKDLAPDQFALYDLIWCRFIASQMREAIFEVTIVEVRAKEYLFRAKGERVKFLGFLKVYGKPRVFELPELKVNEGLNLLDLISKQKSTEPPQRYTEATLIKALEREGVGRPSTYAPIISTIQDRNYVVKKGKYFYPEELGEVVTKLLKKNFPKIVDIKFTAKMENDLDDIAEGKLERVKFLKEFWIDFEKNLKQKEKEVKKKDVIAEKVKEKCPECGKKLEVKFGKFGKFLSCMDYPKCKFSKPQVDTGSKMADKKIEEKVSGQKCKKCGAKMLAKESKFGPFLACSKYPKCKFTKSIVRKIGKSCPECKKGDIIERRTKAGKVFWGCSKYPKCKWATWEDPIKIEPKAKEIKNEQHNSKISSKANR